MITKCYQCETPIQLTIPAVHPLCDDCYGLFENWLERELRLLDSVK